MFKFSGRLNCGYRQLKIAVSPKAVSICLHGRTLTPGTIYGYLYDSKQQLRGQILLEKHWKELAVAAHRATPGSVAGPVEAGPWILHLFNLENTGHSGPQQRHFQLVVDFDKPLSDMNLQTITVIKDGRSCFDMKKKVSSAARWYRGDLHTHTQLSDGHHTMEEAVAIVESRQLDFIFLTEHNLSHTFLPVSNRTLFVPGIEITTQAGHFNVHGPIGVLEIQPQDFSSKRLIEAGLALGKNGHIALNHPLMKPWQWRSHSLPLSQVNSLEVCCDPTWHTSNQAAEQSLAAMTALWNGGRRIFAVGGSDSHLGLKERNPGASDPSIYGDPATCVFCSRGLSGESLIKNLRQGRVYIERSCRLQFSINEGEVCPGDDAGGRMLNYRLSVDDRQRKYRAEFVADGKTIARIDLRNEAVDFQVDMRRFRWLRVDIRRENGEFEGLINPVYNGKHACFRSPSIHTWGELTTVLAGRK